MSDRWQEDVTYMIDVPNSLTEYRRVTSFRLLFESEVTDFVEEIFVLPYEKSVLQIAASPFKAEGKNDTTP